MADISKLNVNGTDYNVKDATARNAANGKLASTTKYAGSDSVGGSATSAKTIDGLTRTDTKTWGKRTATSTAKTLADFSTSGGGGIAIVDNEPNSGQVSLLIDGTVYTGEGQNDVSKAIKSITRSGKTFTATHVDGSTSTFDQQDTTYSSLKNPNALTVQFNGTTNKTYDGSSAQTVNITPSAIGAAASSHTHNYAGSSSAGGAANSANKLATARTLTVGNEAKSFDGSANVSWTHPLKMFYYGSDTANTAGWYKMCTFTQKGYSDTNLNLLITSGYSTQAAGLLYVHVRCDNGTANSIKTLKWMYRYGFAAGNVYFKDNGNNTWNLYVYQSTAQYGRIQVQVLTETDTSAAQKDVSFANNYTKESSAPTGGTAATDGATVSYANSAGNASKVNNHSVNTDVPSGAVFTDTKIKTYTMTLKSSSWSGSSAPYSYDLGSTYGAKAVVQFNGASGTTAQLEAAQAANIVGGSGTKIYAFGDKPTVDIPVVILYE